MLAATLARRSRSVTTMNVIKSEGQEDLAPMDYFPVSYDPLCPSSAAPEAATANASQRNGTMLRRRRGSQGSGCQVSTRYAAPRWRTQRAYCYVC